MYLKEKNRVSIETIIKKSTRPIAVHQLTVKLSKRVLNSLQLG